MKKILFMVSTMNLGGVEKSLLSLLSAMPKEKYEISVLLLFKDGDLLKLLPDWVKLEEADWFQNIRPIVMQPPRKTIEAYYSSRKYISIFLFIFMYTVSKLFNNRYYFYKYVFRKVPCNHNKYDVAIAYQGPTDIIDFYIANKVNAPQKFSWVHFDISKFKINKKLYKRLYKKFNRIFAVSKTAKEKLIDFIPDVKNKIEVFSNIVPNNEISIAADEHITFDSTFKGIKLVTVARLSEEKGPDIAVKTFSRLIRDGFQVKWYWIGEGGYREKVQKLIKEYGVEDRFLLMRAVLNPYPYILKSDIYIQTSKQEGYCITIAEAKCLRKPIVSTYFTGVEEQIIHGQNGYITACDDIELYNGIKFMIENPEIRNRLVENLNLHLKETVSEVNKLTDLID